MAYDLHIKRESGISLAEWKLAVASVPGLRLDDLPTTATNHSGDRVVVFGRDGDVAVLLEDEWVKVFCFFEGSIKFKAGCVDTNNQRDPVMRAAFALAGTLGARVLGDEGEEYELYG